MYEHYKKAVNEKVASLEIVLQDLVETTKNETKSSAGDKHETARAMLQIEHDNVRKQLKDAIEQKALFDRINIVLKTPAIVSGSLVQTDKANFFISVALGKAVVEGITVIALSPKSPLGKMLIGLKTNERVSINGTTYNIQSFE